MPLVRIDIARSASPHVARAIGDVVYEASGIANKAGIRIQDVWISPVDVARQDWSFGNGEMQYAPMPK